MILFILMCLAGLYFGWALGGFIISAVKWIIVLREVKAWKALKAGK